MLNKYIKDMVKDDINFNHKGHATYSQVKAVINICKTVWERATSENKT